VGRTAAKARAQGLRERESRASISH
jgi:hypothetical protein